MICVAPWSPRMQYISISFQTSCKLLFQQWCHRAAYIASQHHIKYWTVS